MAGKTRGFSGQNGASGAASGLWAHTSGGTGRLDAGREGFELGAVFFVAGVVGADFGPEGGGMVKVMEVGEFVEDDVVTQGGRDLHETDVEGDGAGRGTTAPTGGGVGEAAAFVMVAVEGGEIL